MTKKKKAVLYCRLACMGNNDVLSVQEQMLKKYVKPQDYEIVEVIKELCSGTDLNRSGIAKILVFIKDFQKKE